MCRAAAADTVDVVTTPVQLQPPTVPTPPARRVPVWARWLIGVCVVALGVPVAFAAAVIWSLSGGWDGIRPQPEADDRQVVRARKASGAELERLTAATLPVVGGAELARARTDECEMGQNNWKVHEGYKLRCERSDVVVLAVGGLDGGDGVELLAGRIRAAGLTGVYPGSDLGDGSSDTGRYASTAVPDGSVEVTVVRRPAESYFDPTARADPADVQGDPDAVLAALRQRGPSVVLLRTTVRYFES